MIRLLLLGVLLAGCPRQQAPPAGAAGPAEAVQDFAAAIQRGDTATAWALLSTRTQQQANQLAAAARPDAGDGRAMLFGSALPAGPVTVRQSQQSGDSAEVQTATADGGTGRAFHVVREGERWRVDLDLGR
jgi:hypothetical protein